jgi:type II secretory pathway pseudopilin PulG
MIELMLVVVILGLLARLVGNEFTTYIMRAKRTEAILGLGVVWSAQRTYLADHGTYAPTFPVLSTFEVTGGQLVSPTEYRGRRYTYQLSQPWGPTSFYCIATAQLDGDLWPDIVELYETPDGVNQ